MQRVKLDWVVVEELLAAGSDGRGAPTPNLFEVDVTLVASVEYRLYRNNKQIGTVVTSSKEFNTKISTDINTDIGVFGLALENEFKEKLQPNFAFCDEEPDLGVNCYQLKAKLLDSDANLFVRSLNAIY
ncbi:hypothetical protein [Chengkuizengella sediminis]|uniref:hypothetical protein n=1 Tax=Chengkuizengella sediminis TaxID=1885917 RepID=UPI001389C9EB|nr:hypothetical protein [Chengkuizengella sediminis]NDI36356.1 hypothetical protein [Chengkuizengella sediminis]